MTETLILSIGAGVLFICIGISLIVYAVKYKDENKSQRQKAGNNSNQIQIGDKTNKKEK